VPLNYRAAPDAYYISKPKYILVKLVSIISKYVSVYQAKIPVHEDVIGGNEALVALVYRPEKKRIVESTVIECFKRLCYEGSRSNFLHSYL